MKALVLAATAVLITTPVFAQEAPAPASPAPEVEEAADPRFVESPIWLPRDKPRGSLFPEKALAKNVSGSAEAECTVKADGRLEKCRIVSEEPKLVGFGDALINVTKLMKMKPLDEDGQPTAGKLVSVPFDFKIPK